MNYKDYSKYFKVLADENRLKILDMLSCGEICAWKILKILDITQSTLSHHMKILNSCSLVKTRKNGKLMYYSQNKVTIKSIKTFMSYITKKKEDCICYKLDRPANKA